MFDHIDEKQLKRIRKSHFGLVGPCIQREVSIITAFSEMLKNIQWLAL